MIFYLIDGLAILIACGLFAWWYVASIMDKEPSDRIWWVLGSLWLCSFAYAFGSPLFVNYVGTAVFFDEDGKVTEVVKGPAVCFSRCIEHEPRTFSQTGTVTPITENPKVRRLTYAVTSRVVDIKQYYSTIGVTEKVQETVQFHLYEFNNARSKELAEFYNPLDPAQRDRLQEIIKGFMDPRLAPYGIEIKALDGFSIE